MKYLKTILLATVVAIAGVFLLSETVYAGNIKKPLNNWAQTQITVLNSDYDNAIHFEIAYDLDTLLQNVITDGTVDIGPYLRRWRAPVPRTEFTRHDINEMLRIGYMFEREEEPGYIYWIDYALDLKKPGTWDLIDDLTHDPNNLFQNIAWDDEQHLIDSHLYWRQQHAINEITYFWVIMYRIDSPAGYVDGTRGEGGQIMGDYYWGVTATSTETPGHSWLTVPHSYGTGRYCINIMTRLGTWDGSYYSDWMYSPPSGPGFRVDRFNSVLPTATGTMTNLGSDSMIAVDIPAYSTFANYVPGFSPAQYMVEVSTQSDFPWPGILGTPKTVCAYAEAKDEAMKLYVSVKDLAIHGVNTLYGRIRCLGPKGEYWTERNPTSMGTISVIHWDPLLAPPSSVTAKNPPNPNAGGDIDSSILVTIDETAPSGVVHDGYAVKIDITGADSKVYSKTYNITGLSLVDVNPSPFVEDFKVEGVVRTIDVKELFDDGSNFLRDVVGVPINAERDITLSVESTKAGYANSTSVEATYPLGYLRFKNTTDTFFPAITNIDVYSVNGTPTIRAELSPYPSIPSTVPPYADDVHYEIQYSRSNDFPWDPDLTMTTYDAPVPGPSQPSISFSNDVSDILDLDTLPNTIYVRVRLLKDGYTPSEYTNSFVITITTLPPRIINFTADPNSGIAPLTVTFIAQCENATHYTWVFGDGEMVPEHPSYQIDHTYQESGIYAVTLLALGPGGISDPMQKKDYIKVYSCADFDQDFDVDWADLKVFNAALWSRRGQPNYNEHADFNGDGAVNFYDFAVFANEWNPRPPSNLSAQAVSSNEITLSWQDNIDGEAGFTIERKMGDEGAFQPLPDGVEQDVATYSDNGLAAGQTYYYRVYAYGGDRRTGYSNQASATTPAKVVTQGQTIQGVIDSSSDNDTICVPAGTYEEDISIEHKDNLKLVGVSAGETVLKGTVAFKDSDSSIEKFTILYKDGGALSYSNDYYTDFTLLKDAAVTAINSGIAVKDCIIISDSDIDKYGRGIQIWNMRGSADIEPIIIGNEISYADTAIYLYSHSNGGAINGEICDNMLEENNYGIIVRMHKESPLIDSNTMSNPLSAGIHGIHITYGDGELYTQRLSKISNNTITDYQDDIHCDELGF